MNKKLKRYALIAVTVLLVAGVIVWAFRPPPIVVETAQATRSDFQRTVEEDGKTRVRDRYVLSAPVAGRLLRMPWKAGDRVKAEDVVAILLPTPSALLDARTRRELQEQLGAADAAVTQSGAESRRAAVVLEEKRIDFERARKLLADKFISQADFDRARMAFEAAERAVEAAKAQRHVAEHQLDQARAALSLGERGRGGEFKLVAPINAAILKVVRESEAVVGVGEPLLELADPGNVEVVVELLTDEAQLVTRGAKATLQRQSLPALRGEVRLVEPSARTKISALGVEEQRVNVIIDITSPKEEWSSLGDGFRLGVSVEVERRANALTVPAGAVFNHAEGAAVFVVGGNGRAHLRGVKTGSSSRTHTVIDSGLNDGETVIVYPSDAITDGVSVKF